MTINRPQIRYISVNATLPHSHCQSWPQSLDVQSGETVANMTDRMLRRLSGSVGDMLSPRDGRLCSRHGGRLRGECWYRVGVYCLVCGDEGVFFDGGLSDEEPVERIGVQFWQCPQAHGMGCCEV